MPEAAEVYKYKNFLHEELRDAEIVSINVVSGRYSKKPIAGLQTLVGWTVAAVKCKGKLLAFELVNDHPDFIGPRLLYLLNTLGMTGHWSEHADGRNLRLVLEYRKTNADTGESTVGKLYFHDQRNFGTFKIATQKAYLKKLRELGLQLVFAFDVVQRELKERIQRFGKNKPIAEVLLDQRVFCGVGNYMRAEALYYASVHPKKLATDLTHQEIAELYRQLQRVLNNAFLGTLHLQCYGQKTTRSGKPVEKYKDSKGRTVWWCPVEYE